MQVARGEGGDLCAFRGIFLLFFQARQVLPLHGWRNHALQSLRQRCHYFCGIASAPAPSVAQVVPGRQDCAPPAFCPPGCPSHANMHRA